MNDKPGSVPPVPLWKRLAGATLNYGLGSLLPQILAFLMVPVFTAFLSPADYGLLELAASLGAVLVILMRLGMTGAINRFYFDYREGEPLRDYITSLVWFLLVLSLAISGVVLAVMYFAGDLLTPGLAFFPYVLLVVLANFFSGNTDVQRRLVQAREQSSYNLRLNLFTAAVITSLSVVFVVIFRFGAAGMLLAELTVNIVLFTQAIHYLRTDLTGRFQRSLLGGSLRYAAGILPSQIAGTISQTAIRSILAGFQSLDALGLFALASRFARPLSIVILAFATAYQPIYFAARKEGTDAAHERLARVTAAVWLLAVWGCLGVSTLGPVAIVMLTPESFHAAAPLVPWLALGWMAQVLAVVGNSEVYYQKATWFVPLTTLAVIPVQLATTLAVARPWGAKGLAVASALGLWVNGGMMLGYSRRMVKLPVNWRGLATATVLGLALGIAVSLAPWQHLWARAAIAASACAVFPALLLLLKDDTAHEAVALVRNRFVKRRA